MFSTVQTSQKPVWLLATPTAAAFATRRAIIRSTWQALYNNTDITLRFVLARVDPEYAFQINAENQTYGDIISLPWLDENHYTANTIKQIELFRCIRILPDRSFRIIRFV